MNEKAKHLFSNARAPSAFQGITSPSIQSNTYSYIDSVVIFMATLKYLKKSVMGA